MLAQFWKRPFSFSPRKDEYASLTELEGEIHQEMEKKEQLKQEFRSNPFSKVIGYDGSLADSIKKLKAAVLYPPKGLNIMLTGESGVGKTLLAEHLHEFFESKTETKSTVHLF